MSEKKIGIVLDAVASDDLLKSIAADLLNDEDPDGADEIIELHRENQRDSSEKSDV